MLKLYGLSFSDLVQHSPKHADARIGAIKIAKVLVEDKELLQHLLNHKRIPVKLLEQKVSVSRKTIERNRKYIIAIALIFTNDYMYLKDYLKGVLDV